MGQVVWGRVHVPAGGETVFHGREEPERELGR